MNSHSYCMTELFFLRVCFKVARYTISLKTHKIEIDCWRGKLAQKKRDWWVNLLEFLSLYKVLTKPASQPTFPPQVHHSIFTLVHFKEMETIGLMWTITMYHGLASSIVMLVCHSLNKLTREHDKVLYPPMNGTFWTSHH
jgi:hypothetical protein